jgi:hypothetical protein
VAKVNYPAHKKIYRFSTIKNSLAILFEDNIVCINKLKGGYIKGDKTKHISYKNSFILSSNKKEKLISKN